MVDQSVCFIYLIKGIDEPGGGIVPQRHPGVHTLSRCQHLCEGVWELPGSYAKGHALFGDRASGQWVGVGWSGGGSRNLCSALLH